MKRRESDPEFGVAAPDVLLTRPGATVGDSVVVATWTLISRITGFGRVATTAAVLGPTYFGNTYQASNALPNIIYYGLLAGSLVSSLLVPALVGHIDAGRTTSCERIASGALGLSLAGLVFFVPVAFVGAPYLLQLAALGSASPAVAPGQAHVARMFLIMLLPQVFLYAVVACSAAVMNAHRRFALAAGAPAIENIGSIAVLVTTAILYPGETAIDAVPTGEMLLLGLGTTAAVALHAAVQWYGARRTGVSLRPTAGWRDAAVTAIVRRAVPALAQAGLEAVQLLAVLFVANRVAGGVVAYQMAMNFFFLPIAVGATPVALSLLPRLSRLHQNGEPALFRDTAVRGLRFAMFLAVPAAVALFILAPVLGTAVSFGRMVPEGGAVLVASALVALAPGVIGEAAFLLGTYSSYSRQDTHGPLVSMVVKFVVCMALLALALTRTGPSVVMVVGLAVSTAAVAAACHRLIALLTGLPMARERLLPAALRTLLSATVMAGPLWYGAWLLREVDGQFVALAGAMAACLISGTVYVGVQLALRAPEARWLLAALAGRGGRR